MFIIKEGSDYMPPLWHEEDYGSLKMFLYDRSQNHGDHNLSHFHVNFKNQNCVFDIKGNVLAGKINNEK